MRILGLLLVVCMGLMACRGEVNVFFVHGANVSERGSRAWASEMFKRLWHAGARMQFHPVSWESDIGPSYNYHVNASNAFVTARRLAAYANSVEGRKIVIAHSLGTLVAASAIQDHGMQVEKLLMFNSAIPSEAFDPSLANDDPANNLVHDDWVDYTNACWTANWHRLFPEGDARHRLTWRGRFEQVARVAVNFYSSGDEVLEIYGDAHNPSWYNGLSSADNWGERYAWHKQELYKGRRSLLGFIGTTDWSGWGFRTRLGVRLWSAAEANAVADCSVFATNTVFAPHPLSITNSVATRLETDFHLAMGIPALSGPTGRVCFRPEIMESYDLNSPAFMGEDWPRSGDGNLDNRFLHSDIKNMAYFHVHRVFRRIVEIGGLNQ